MEQLVREGKVTYVGSSNFAGWDLLALPDEVLRGLSDAYLDALPEPTCRDPRPYRCASAE
jgi:aryl-alcohol dehydrogenase-like predicted oxidoreductase